MSKAMHWVYLIIISILLILVWQERQLPDFPNTAEPEQRSVPVDVASVNGERNMDMLLELMNSLQEDNRRLVAQVELLEQQLLDQQVQAESDVAGSDVTATDNASEREPASEQRESVERAREFLTSDDLRERVENEEVDPVWAYDMELALGDLFRSNEALRDLNVERIECRTTVCAIDIWTDNSVVGGLNIPALFRHLNDEDWFTDGQYNMISFSESESDTQRVMIVRRHPDEG